MSEPLAVSTQQNDSVDGGDSEKSGGPSLAALLEEQAKQTQLLEAILAAMRSCSGAGGERTDQFMQNELEGNAERDGGDRHEDNEKARKIALLMELGRTEHEG